MGEFAGTATAPLRLLAGHLSVRLFVDASSVEAFINDGGAVLTSLMLPSAGKHSLSLVEQRGSVRGVRIEGWTLASIWPPGG